MLCNRIQATSSLFAQTQFNFATKNLKVIKLRMKAVESIRKITKVYFITMFRPWRWWLHPRWSRMSEDSKELNISVLDQYKKSSIIKLSFKRRDKPSPLKNGFLCPSQPIRDCAGVLTLPLSDKSKLWLKQIEAPTKYSSLEIKVQLPLQDLCQIFSNTQLLTSKHL